MGWRSLAALLACVVLVGQAAENPPEAALALADALHLTDGAKSVLIGKAANGVQRGENSQKELDCLQAADFGPVKVAYAEALAASLNDAEIDAAMKFFSSEHGRRYAQTWELHNFKTLTDQDHAGIRDFFNSEAGRKLMLVLVDDKGFMDRLLPRLMPMLDRCMEQKSVAQFFDRVAPVTGGASEDTSPPASKEALRRLIRAMRDDEAMVLASQQRLPAHENHVSKRQVACIAGIKPAQITDSFAAGINGQLTSSEVNDALAFYESKAGQGFTQSLIDRFRLPPGQDVTGTDYVLRYMTPDQVLEMKEFVKKPVARKLMVDKITEHVIDGVQRRLIELVQECAETGGVISERTSRPSRTRSMRSAFRERPCLPARWPHDCPR